ncbi:MAG: hypothetical protein QOH37_3604 [Nocardioidaceae bacterium]|jgi:steroid delta-isomerase-like uncharacterized protein|nr:hypothetical protein [Nocardioidaceae bacterium]
MVPEHEATVRRFFDELWNDGDLDCADDVLSPAHIHHIGDVSMVGPDEVKDTVVRFRTAFPDLHFDLEDVISDADRVVVRWTATGTHAGEFAGVAATGRSARWTGIDLVRLEDGRIVELWAAADGAGLFEQLTE